MKLFCLLAAAAAFSAVSCERHDWEETKILHEAHGAHGHDEHAEHAEHGEEGHAGEHAEEAH
ncbi:hypothetical protein HNR46_003105 [Haloferula luteola]|uniref:Uncharacterized protein n=1 Tax=Haloferula luteola TaxID=595692 RepID=A0A840V3I0_9BACT|nr:hypothetical protein [Haloferula luteola]MBB5352857.1 hypothetical protein [Haloferula luteola]